MKLAEGETGMLSAYTKEMHQLIRGFETQEAPLDKEAFYLFLRRNPLRD